MKTLAGILLLLVCFSCKKNNGSSVQPRLLKTEAEDYRGDIVYATYNYDAQGRITSITEQSNNQTPVTAVTISYTGNTVKLLSSPKTDPSAQQEQTVTLTLNPNGTVSKRLAYIHKLQLFTSSPYESDYTDTALYEYDPAGFLTKITRSGLDTAWNAAVGTAANRFNLVMTATTTGNNLISTNSILNYTRVTYNGGTPVLVGGSDITQTQYGYTNSFPNRLDFSNAAVLTEYWDQYYTFTPWLYSGYKNLPDEVRGNLVIKDINGNTVNTYNSTTILNRLYNAAGVLSEIIETNGNNAYSKVRFYYAK